MTDKYPTPWRVEKETIAGFECSYIVDSNGDHVPATKEAAQRTVACVNACRGLETKSLESISRMIDSSECRICGKPEGDACVHVECLRKMGVDAGWVTRQ